MANYEIANDKFNKEEVIENVESILTAFQHGIQKFEVSLSFNLINTLMIPLLVLLPGVIFGTFSIVDWDMIVLGIVGILVAAVALGVIGYSFIVEPILSNIRTRNEIIKLLEPLIAKIESINSIEDYEAFENETIAFLKDEWKEYIDILKGERTEEDFWKSFFNGKIHF